MAGDNGSNMSPDALARALKPLFEGVSDRITVEVGGVRTEIQALRTDVQTLRTDVQSRLDVLPRAIASAVAPHFVELRTHLDRNLAVRAEQDGTINMRLDHLEERVDSLEKKRE